MDDKEKTAKAEHEPEIQNILTFNTASDRYKVKNPEDTKDLNKKMMLWYEDLKPNANKSGYRRFSGTLTYKGKSTEILSRKKLNDRADLQKQSKLMSAADFFPSTLITLMEIRPDSFDVMLQECPTKTGVQKQSIQYPYLIETGNTDAPTSDYKQSHYKKGNVGYTRKSDGSDTHRIWCDQIILDFMVSLFTLCKKLGIDLALNLHPTKVSKMPEKASNSYNQEAEASELFGKLEQLVNNKVHQIVLTGAPGTGKTYISKQLVLGSITENDLYDKYNDWSNLPEEERPDFYPDLQDFISNLLDDTSFYEKKDIEHLLSQLKYKSELLDKVYQESTSKEEDLTGDILALRGVMSFVQFHPSYDYTDFVDGIRPIEQENGVTFKRMDGTFMSFCRYVAWRNQTYHQKGIAPNYFFLIDEINRADLSKVLGELMFCLEGDKRGSTNSVQTQYNNLTSHFLDKDGKKMESTKENEGFREIFKNGFYIPENVVVIGTMNDIDRSIESMDFALRRRFSWVNVEVDYDFLEDAFESGDFFSKTLVDSSTDYTDELTEEKKKEQEIARQKNKTQKMKKIQEGVAQRVCAFNEAMDKAGFQNEYYIAQGHFTNIVLNEETDDDYSVSADSSAEDIVDRIMDWVWEYRISTLITEYLRGDSDSQKFEALKNQWYTKMVSMEDENGAQGDEQSGAEAEQGEARGDEQSGANAVQGDEAP